MTPPDVPGHVHTIGHPAYPSVTHLHQTMTTMDFSQQPIQRNFAVRGEDDFYYTMPVAFFAMPAPSIGLLPMQCEVRQDANCDVMGFGCLFDS